MKMGAAPPGWSCVRAPARISAQGKPFEIADGRFSVRGEPFESAAGRLSARGKPFESAAGTFSGQAMVCAVSYFSFRPSVA
jgi:hypothetical protein